MHHNQMVFLSPPASCRKAGRSQRWAVPEGSTHLTQTLTPAQEAFNLGLKDLKTLCISFSFASDASFAMFTLALVDRGDWLPVVCLLFPPGPRLAPGPRIVLPAVEQEMLHVASPRRRRRICDLHMGSSWYPRPESRLKTQQMHLLWRWRCSAWGPQAAQVGY